MNYFAIPGIRNKKLSIYDLCKESFGYDIDYFAETKSRKADFIRMKHSLIYLAYKYYKYRMIDCCNIFELDHKSFYHAIKSVSDKLDSNDESFIETYNKIDLRLVKPHTPVRKK